MGIQERKEKQKQEIRKLILDAAMKLFVEEGFDNLTIRRIADLIEYSPTTVYLYFKDKDEILASLHEQGFQKMQEFNRNLIAIQNPFLRLHKMGENYIQFAMEQPEYYNLMFIDREPMKKMAAENCLEWAPGDSALQTLKEVVIECMEQGYLEKAEPLLVTLSIWSFVHGLMSLVIRERLEKFVHQKEMILPTVKASLNWFINNIESKDKKKPNGH
ncbi:TetR/AcrR family transcriptional regulator [Puia dinghuensis]|uniref:TetR family transcriptional regulator n=1 Tax=Puia dinghuensis TaxID=1792502 RepID=A0A8J2UEK0_9BACT|nr:TetR/AcrR family transcriptional regulator [Puia dinghuensis]GGB05943.1 TetR family transcriptional regulator [Puia dinghuensis]